MADESGESGAGDREKMKAKDARWAKLVVVGTYLVVIGIAIRLMACCGGVAPTLPEVYLRAGLIYGAISCLGWVLVMRGRPEEDQRLGLFGIRVAALTAVLLGEVSASMSIYWLMLKSTYGNRMSLILPVFALAALWLLRRYWGALMAPQGWPYRKNWNGLCAVFAALMVMLFTGTLIGLVFGPVKGDEVWGMIGVGLTGVGLLGGGFAYMCVVFDLGLLAKHLVKRG